MTSSIYPLPANVNFVGSVATLTIDVGGSGYTPTPGITIDSPIGILATATSSINSIGGVSSVTIVIQGAGYVSPPNVDIAIPTSGIQATGTANLSNGQVISITITNAGSGYTSAPTVTIANPNVDAVTATGTAATSDGVINVISAIGGANTGYVTGESITLSGGTPTTTATATAIISGGSVQSITFTNRGAGYAALDLITINGATSSNATFTVTSIDDDVITSVALSAPNFGGSGYISAPGVTATGGGGTGAVITATISSVPSGDILSNDIAITNELVSPGGGGILRLYFAFVFDSSPGDITVTNNGVDKGALNADNDSQLVSNGYYRFDIDVESGDNINLILKGTASATNITSTNFIRAHLVQFGA